MRITSNYHMHTHFCDGNNSPAEMLEAALKKGFTEIGFSGHSYTPFDKEVCMSPEDSCKYLQEIHLLKEKYRGRISILAGIEQDYFSTNKTEAYDYVIGSVHYVLKEGKYLAVDESVEGFLDAVKNYYDNDVYAFIEDYYNLVGDVVNMTNADIIGHFDLITKFNEVGKFFSENHPRYVAAVDGALQKLVQTNRLFEINTGAMSRGYRSMPYPSESIIRKIAEMGGRFIISSDAHSAENIDFGFSQVIDLLNKLSVDETAIVMSPDLK